MNKEELKEKLIKESLLKFKKEILVDLYLQTVWELGLKDQYIAELPQKICDEIRENHKSYEYEYMDKIRTIYSINNDDLGQIQKKYEG